MKTIITIGILLASAAAFAGSFLVSESTSGNKKYCKYQDGSIVTISSLDFCPTRND